MNDQKLLAFDPADQGSTVDRSGLGRFEVGGALDYERVRGLRMTTWLTYPDHRADPAAWARQLGISSEAVELYLASEVIDLHWDTYLWYRLIRYDPRRRHSHGLLGARFYSHVDFPRLREACVSGAMWVITTNVWRRVGWRAAIAVENVRRLQGLLECAPADIQVVRA